KRTTRAVVRQALLASPLPGTIDPAGYNTRRCLPGVFSAGIVMRQPEPTLRRAAPAYAPSWEGPIAVTSQSLDSFKSRRTLTVGKHSYEYFSLPEAEKNGLAGISSLPVSLKALLENLLRMEDG